MQTNNGNNLLMNKIINLYAQGCSISQIIKLLKVSRETVNKALIEADVDTDCKARALVYSKLRCFNSDLFDNINNEEKAYWLGFIYADGSIDATNRSLIISLGHKDGEHLAKLAKIFAKDIKIYKTSRHGKTLLQSRLKINSIYLCASLNRIGIHPRKTTLDCDDVFEYIPDELLHHFVRGFLDGDGFISQNSDQIGFVGGCRFLSKLKEKLNFMNSPGSFFSDGNVWRLSWHGKFVTSQLASWLYKDATIFMERKYLRAIKCENFIITTLINLE